MQKFLCVGRGDKATVDQFAEIFKANLKRSTEYFADVLEALVGGKMTCHLTVGLSGFRIKRFVEVIFRACVERERADHLFIAAVKTDDAAEVDAGIFPDNEIRQLLFLFDSQRIQKFIKPIIKQRSLRCTEILDFF